MNLKFFSSGPRVEKFGNAGLTGLKIVRGDQNLTKTHTHTHRGPFYKSCFSAKMQKQNYKRTLHDLHDLVCHKTELLILHDILGFRKLAAQWMPHEI